MGKKNSQKKHKKTGISQPGASVASQVSNRIPEVPAFWVAIIIPVICLVGAWTFPPVATPMELKSIWSQIYLSGLLLGLLWFSRNRAISTLTFSPARVCFGLLFIVGTLSLIWAANGHFWVYKWNKWYAAFAIFLLGLQITPRENNLDTIANLVLIGALITAGIGISQQLFGFNLIPQTSFPSSTFGNGNMAGQVMVLTLLLPLYFLFKEKLTSTKAWYYSLSLAALALYIFYTRTRAVWIATALEVVLFSLFLFLDKKSRPGYLHWNSQKSRALICGALIFMLLININKNGDIEPFWDIAYSEISSIARDVNANPEDNGGQRYLLWTSAVKMISDSPIIGTGLGSYFHNMNVDNTYSSPGVLGVQRVHNDVLELFVELGSAGMLALLSIIISMCVLLYKLILRAEGNQRIFYAALTIMVTGSMLNAQLSFPYQLPVPLIIMPFWVSLIIKGSEGILENTFTLSVKSWFQKAALGLSGMVFIFLLVIDISWFRDFHSLNNLVSGKVPVGEWKPVSPIYNQAYVTTTRAVGDALLRANDRYQLIINILEPINQLWPENAANALVLGESNFRIKQYDEAEKWAKIVTKSQPVGAYLGEHQLLQIYTVTGEFDKLRAVYEEFRKLPEEQLKKDPNSYRILHSTAINLKDYEPALLYYQKFTEYHGEVPEVMANQAILYANAGNPQVAIPLMEKALALDPNLQLAKQLKRYIRDNTPQKTP